MKGCMTGIVVALLVLLGIGGCGMSSYNGLVDKRGKIDPKFTEIQNQYKRRSDLIPQLVETVKGAKNFEQETLEKVIQARKVATEINVPESAIENPELAAQFLKAQDGLTSAMSRLLVTVERYPELKATEAFRDLQGQIEGTENRIATARRDYIDVVGDYNIGVKKFPANLLATIFNFEPAPQLPIEAGVEERPAIDFGDKK